MGYWTGDGLSLGNASEKIRRNNLSKGSPGSFSPVMMPLMVVAALDAEAPTDLHRSNRPALSRAAKAWKFLLRIHR